MKKTYIAPELEVVKIQTVGFLAASDPDTMTGSISGDEISSGWAESRGGGFFDDEE